MQSSWLELLILTLIQYASRASEFLPVLVRAATSIDSHRSLSIDYCSRPRPLPLRLQIRLVWSSFRHAPAHPRPPHMLHVYCVCSCARAQSYDVVDAVRRACGSLQLGGEHARLTQLLHKCHSELRLHPHELLCLKYLLLLNPGALLLAVCLVPMRASPRIRTPSPASSLHSVSLIHSCTHSVQCTLENCNCNCNCDCLRAVLSLPLPLILSISISHLHAPPLTGARVRLAAHCPLVDKDVSSEARPY